jgi:hypothetical protein
LLVWSLAWLGALLALAGCASKPDAMIEYNEEAFAAGMDALLKVGMTIKEAQAVLKERMPPASLRTDAPVAGSNRTKLRRVMIGWPTLNPGTTLVVTIFADRDGRIVRWTTGPLLE